MRSYFVTAAVILVALGIVSFVSSLEGIPSIVIDDILFLVAGMIFGFVLLATVWLIVVRRKRRDQRHVAMIERLDNIRAGTRPPEKVSH